MKERNIPEHGGSSPRPRAGRRFSVENALRAAYIVFWRDGYEATTLADLTSAMGFNKTTLYSAFGTKQNLFRLALARYGEEQMAYADEALNQPSGRLVAETLLKGVVAATANEDEPRGCLEVASSVSCGPRGEEVRVAVVERRSAWRRRLTERIERSAADGDLVGSTDTRGLALYLSALAEGIASRAAGGAPRHELDLAADTALDLWPGA